MLAAPREGLYHRRARPLSSRQFPFPHMPTVRAVLTFSSLLCFGLAGIWLLLPQVLLAIWSVSYGEAVGLVARRNACLFLALAVTLWLARKSEPSPALSGLLTGFGTGCLALALLGVVEFASGRAGAGIFAAVLIELPLGVLLLLLLLSKSVSVRS